MSSRFFSETRITSEEVALGELESRHLAKVMRKKTGDRVVLFDGSGCEFLAEIIQIERKTVVLHVLERIEVSRELNFDLAVAAPLPKGDRQTWMLSKLVELGVRRFCPLRTERSVAKPSASALTRLNKCVIEASKQCERNILLEIESPQSFETYVEKATPSALRFIADPSANSTFPNSVTSDVTLLFGPEGGFSPNELNLAAQSGWQPASLGKRILRLETAAVAGAAWFSLAAS